MFLIVNDTSIHRFGGSKVVIGSAQGSDLTIDDPSVSPSQCRLTRDPDGSWRIENIGESQIFVNRAALAPKKPARFGPSDQLRIGNHNLELRDVERGGAVARALRTKLFTLQLELHATVLDIVRNSAGALGERDHRKRIEAELDRLLNDLELGTELEVHLATQAAQEIISDHVQGFGLKPGAQLRDGQSQKNISRFATMIPRVLSLIKFDDSETPFQKAERISILLPWGIKSKNVIQPWERR